MKKNIIEDVFLNKLDIEKTLPKWVERMHKYGNVFYTYEDSEEKHYNK